MTEAESKLDSAALARYASLTEEDTKSLVLFDKWRSSLLGLVLNDVQKQLSLLVTRLTQLERRYSAPLPELERSMEQASERVRRDLVQMGYQWL